eukprot:1158820-Pelagomonas_calceolata.AAC.2
MALKGRYRAMKPFSFRHAGCAPGTHPLIPPSPLLISPYLKSCTAGVRRVWQPLCCNRASLSKSIPDKAVFDALGKADKTPLALCLHIEHFLMSSATRFCTERARLI